MHQSSQNIVFICVDCLRSDFVFDSSSDIPFISSLIDQGLSYTNLFSTTTTTTPSVAGLMTGTYSEYNGINSLRECNLNEGVTTIAENLSEQGIDTAALVTGPITSETGLDRGFNEFWYREQNQNLTGDWFTTAISRIESLSEPFFAYLHLWELHRNIKVPREFDDPKYGNTSYGRMLSALDRAIEKFVSQLPEDTLVVIHGDHGESLSSRHSSLRSYLKNFRDVYRYEHRKDIRSLECLCNRLMDFVGSEFKDHYIEDGHGETLYDFMTNVPLILAGPEIPSVQIKSQCRQIDVFPTLLDYLSINPPESIRGDSLLPPAEVNDRPVYLRACGTSLRGKDNWQRGVRADGYKYIQYPHRNWGPELYDINSDPKELNNIAGDNSDVISRLATHIPDKTLENTGQIDIQDRLKSLGYL